MGYTLTRRRPLAAHSNLTSPSTVANSVKSLPRPTLVPGRILVPFCRTMIEPQVTRSPPYRFTPRRLGLLSRPLLVLPPAFLWAISYSLPQPQSPGTPPLWMRVSAEPGFRGCEVRCPESVAGCRTAGGRAFYGTGSWLCIYRPSTSGLCSATRPGPSPWRRASTEAAPADAEGSEENN